MSTTTFAPAPASSRTVVVAVGSFLAGAVVVGAAAYALPRVTATSSSGLPADAAAPVRVTASEMAALRASRADDRADVAAAHQHAAAARPAQPTSPSSVHLRHVAPGKVAWTLTSS